MKQWARIVLALVPGLAVRLALAPYTSGSDIPQFAAFADTFLRHGFHFLEYSDASKAGLEGWPYPWPYVYGPLTIILLGLVRLAAHGRVLSWSDSQGYHVIAPVDWVVALKLVYIGFDTAAAVLVYMVARRRSPRYALPALILYYYNPMTVYISSIYGMLDMIPLALLLAGVYYWEARGSPNASGLLWGLGAAVKPTILLAALPYSLGEARRHGSKALVPLAWSIIVPLLLLAPFAISSPGGIPVYLHAIRMVGTPNYPSPIVYSFNGFSSIVYYAWEHGGANIYSYLHYWPIPFLLLYALALATSLRDPLLAGALGYTAFTASYWRVNHQYLVPTVAFLVLALPLLRDYCHRLLAFTAWLLVGLWPLMYPVSWWAKVHMAHPNLLVIHVLDSFNMMVFDEVYYIIYGILLVVAQACLITCVGTGVIVEVTKLYRARGLRVIFGDAGET